VLVERADVDMEIDWTMRKGLNVLSPALNSPKLVLIPEKGIIVEVRFTGGAILVRANACRVRFCPANKPCQFFFSPPANPFSVSLSEPSYSQAGEGNIFACPICDQSLQVPQHLRVSLALPAIPVAERDQEHETHQPGTVAPNDARPA